MIRACPSCSGQNRVPAKHLADTGKCGHCKAALPPLDHPLDVGTGEFEEIIAQAKVPVLVDFWAAWCGPCRMAAPEVAKAAQLAAGRALVLKVDTEAHPQIAARFGVQGIPNFVVLKHGRVVKQQAGLVRHSQLLSWLGEA